MSSKISSILVLLLSLTLTNFLNAAPIVGATSVPSAPRNLVTSVVANSISLTWTPPGSNGGAAITGYKIYRGMSAGGESLTPIDTVGNITSIVDNW